MVPNFLARFAVWLLTHTVYRIQIGGKEHVPVRGPALLVCNHLSHIDGLLVGACIPRSARFSVYKTYSGDAALNWLMRPMNAIPVRGDLLHLRFIKTARRRWFSFAMADSTGSELTYGKALAGSLALARWIRRRCSNERMVGVMLPASVGGVLANIATLMAGKVPVNLNFTAGREAIASAIEQCQIKTILTSRVFLAK